MDTQPENLPGHVVALQRAVEHVGSQAKFAAAIADFLARPSFKQQTVSYWLREHTLLGPEWWTAIEHVTELSVTRRDLRPDIYPPGEYQAA